MYSDLVSEPTIVRSSCACARCGRTLKNPKWIAVGYGKICYAKMQQDKEDKLNAPMSDHFINEVPLTDKLVCRRDEQGVSTNVPHLAVWHSPTGYEFGYGGSGPADLALNVVEFTLRHIGFKGETTNDIWGGQTIFSQTATMHQDFKWQFIDLIPREGGEVPFATIQEWVKDRIQLEYDAELDDWL